MSLPPRRTCADWPRVLCPAPGCLMPTAPLERRERVLHVSARNRSQRQVGLTRAFQQIATVYRVLDWGETPPCSLDEQLIRDASDFAPTLVWMQIQRDPSYINADTIRRLRNVCARNAVLVNWDGDQHYEPRDSRRQWFVDLGRALDASFVKNTTYPYEYAALGVRCPGYLGQGVDRDVLRPVAPGADAGAVRVPALVFVAHQHGTLPAYGHRINVAAHLFDTYPGQVGLYGNGWEHRGRPPITEEQQAVVYSRARGALSVSIRADLPRYTSNRLLNILAAGGVALVERFPDCEGLGLVDGVNCLLWTGWEELQARVAWALRAPQAETDALRAAARELSAEHSWEAHMGQLLAAVDVIRATRPAWRVV